MKNNKIYNSSNNDDNENDNINDDISTFKLTHYSNLGDFGKPILNDFTAAKDKTIIERYGKDFWGFFNSSTVSNLPMFTYPPEPKSVKKITADLTISIEANQPCFLSVKPFTRYCFVEMVGTGKHDRMIPEQMLNCFQKYKVVCAKLMVRQVGIMSVNDGYGTVMDAIMVSPNISPEYLKQNLLSVQTAPGRKLMMVDGRAGLTANFIGSPFYKSIFIDNNIIQPDAIIKAVGSTNNIPLDANVKSVGLPSAHYLYENASTTSEVTATQFLSGSMTYVYGTMGVEYPQGDALFIRVSPPSINISLKLYLEMVVEGQVTSDYQTNMPQIIPPSPFDFNRIYFALNNFITPLKVCERDTSFCASKPLIKYNYRPTNKKNKLNQIKVPMRPNKVRKIFLKRGTFIRYALTLNNALKIPDSEIFRGFSAPKTQDKKTSQREKTKQLLDKADIVHEATKSLERYRKFSNISYCSEKGGKVINLYEKIKIKKISNIVNKVELPDYVEEACKFTGLLVTGLKTTDKNNRLFQDAIKPVAHSSYAYFPAINPNKNIVYPAIVAYCLGNFAKDKVTFKVPDPMEEDGVKEITFYVDLEQFDNGDEFLGVLETIVKWAYVKNFHYVPEEPITIKFFGYGKFKDKSYMYALMACLYSGPAGGYYTGSFSYKKPSFFADKMDENVLKLKTETASPDHPLIFLGEGADNAVQMNVLSGIVPSYADGKLIPVASVFQATLYSIIPFSIRTIKNTPLVDLNADAKRFMSDFQMSYPLKYIALSNAYSLTAIDNIINNKMPYTSIVRANPDNFTCYIKKNNRIFTADTYYDKFPELLDVGKKYWHFDFNGRKYVERNLFNADLRKYPITSSEKAEEKNIAKYEKLNKDIMLINEKDFKNLISRREDQIEVGKDELKKTLAEVEEMKINPKATTKDIEKFNEYLNPIVETFTAFFKKLRKDKPEINNRRRIRADKPFWDLMGQLGVESYVKNASKIEESLYMSAIKSMIQHLGNGNVLTIATLGGFNKRDHKLSKGAVNAALEALRVKFKDLELPKDDNEDKNIKDEISQLTEKRRNKIKKEAQINTNIEKITGTKKKKESESEESDSSSGESSEEEDESSEEEEDEKEEKEKEKDEDDTKERKRKKKRAKEKARKKRKKARAKELKGQISPVISEGE